jgi:DNA-directed RNA polymerase specialized sigma subunit
MGTSAVKKIRVSERDAVLREFTALMRVSIDHIREHSRVPIEEEDLLAAAVTGLLEAMRGYDPSVDRSFRSFAELSMRRAMLDEVRRAADFYHHIKIQPVGPAEATHHAPKLTFGFDRKGHKFH